MPAKKGDTDKPKRAETDPQGHRLDGPDAVPTAEDYDPAKHANHSHLNPH